MPPKPEQVGFDLTQVIESAKPALERGLGDKLRVGVLCKLGDREAFVPVDLYLDMLKLQDALRGVEALKKVKAQGALP